MSQIVVIKNKKNLMWFVGESYPRVGDLLAIDGAMEPIRTNSGLISRSATPAARWGWRSRARGWKGRSMQDSRC